MTFTFTDLVECLVKIFIIFNAVMGAVAYLVLLERWIAAWVQDRYGPNRVGPLGLLQPIADGVKFVLKEGLVPGHVDKIPYLIAPVVMYAAAICSFAVIPFGGVLRIPGLDRDIPLVIAPGFNVGLVYIFALSGLAVYGVLIGGWASNNKYSFLGGLRASAQLIAYEIPLGLAILGVVLMGGSLDIDVIVNQQASTGMWFFFAQPLGFLVFFVAALAESARLPFDLPECEQELIGGYHTEYTGMKLAAFLMSEFIHMVMAAVLCTLLFFGGWHFWGITGGGNAEVGIIGFLLRVAILSAKIMAFIVLFMMIRWSWPRFRFDQLMDMAWKVMVPLGMINLALVAVLNELARMQWITDSFENSAQIGFAILSWVITFVVLAITSMLTAIEPKPQAAALPGGLD